MVWYSQLLKNFPQFVVIYTVKGFGIINKAEVDVFLEFSCLWSRDVGNLISSSSAFSKSCLNIWKFTIHILLKPGLENFEHSFASVWDECNCGLVWTFFAIALLWDWNGNWPFPGQWPQGTVTPQETDPDLPVSVQEPLAEAWVPCGLLQGWGHCMWQCPPQSVSPIRKLS